jgi:NADH:ubiquinone oxidoreductase subunit K
MNSLFTPALALLLQGSVWDIIKQAADNIWLSLQYPDLSKFLIIGALLFTIGVAGVLTRRNIIVIFMSIELILNAANLNFIVFSRYLQETGGMNAVAGQVFTVFIIVVAAAEAAIGLGLVIALYRNRETIFVDKIDLLKW